MLGHAWQRAGGGVCSLRLVGDVDEALEPVLSASGIPHGEPPVPGWTVLDSYRAPRPNVRDLVVVDDFRQRNDHGSPIVVDQNFGADASLYPEAESCAARGPTSPCYDPNSRSLVRHADPSTKRSMTS